MEEDDEYPFYDRVAPRQPQPGAIDPYSNYKPYNAFDIYSGYKPYNAGDIYQQKLILSLYELSLYKRGVRWDYAIR